jgi:hypothetical protein
MPKFEIAWDAPEFEYREKDVSWYWISIIIAAAIVAFAVWFHNFLFGFFIVVAEVLFIVWGNRPPRLVDFHVDDTGISIDNFKFHAFREFESWSVEALNDEWNEMFFNFRSRIKPTLKVLVPHEKMDALRANLKTVLKEVEHQPTFLDAIEKFLRF